MGFSIPKNVIDSVENFHYFPDNFSKETSQEVQNILQYGILDDAPSRKYREGLSIDGAESLDLDDAIWVEKTKSGYCLWVDIADVSEAVRISSALDIDAMMRTTSVYRKDFILPMIPKELSNGVLSLNQESIKKTMTLQIDISDEGIPYNFDYYESNFKNIARLDYYEFGDIYENKDHQLYGQLHLLHQLSDKLRIQRIKNGGVVGYRETDRRVGNFHQPENQTYSKKIAHDIIESIMVLSNCMVGGFLEENNIDAIFKHHGDIRERSFYVNTPGYHHGLAVRNYTHFTSPIRRYVDIIVHRVLKSISRGEQNPYDKTILAKHADFSNMTRIKVETLGKQMDFEQQGRDFIERLYAKNQEVQVSDMTQFIKHSLYKHKKIPKGVQEKIIEQIEHGSRSHWGWIIGVILNSQNNDLIQFMKNKLLYESNFSTSATLNLIDSTRLIKGGPSIFKINEQRNNQQLSISCVHNHQIIAQEIGNIDEKNSIRYRLIAQIFDYFLALNKE